MSTRPTATAATQSITGVTRRSSTTTNTSSTRSPGTNPNPVPVPEPQLAIDDEDDTEPMRARAEHLLHAPATPWHWGHRPPARDLLEDEPEQPAPEPESLPPLGPAPEPIGFAHNGFNVEAAIAEPRSPAADILGGGHARYGDHDDGERPSRHQLAEDQPEPRQFWFQSHGRHSRDDPDDASSYGRHSMPGRD